MKIQINIPFEHSHKSGGNTLEPRSDYFDKLRPEHARRSRPRGHGIGPLHKQIQQMQKFSSQHLHLNIKSKICFSIAYGP